MAVIIIIINLDHVIMATIVATSTVVLFHPYTYSLMFFS